VRDTVSKQNNDKTISALEEDLLTPLSKRSLYGLQFVNAFREASGGKRELGLGSLYPTLARLQRDGLVTCKWGDEEMGARRKYYEITLCGKKALIERSEFRENLVKYAALPESETLDVEAQSMEKDNKPGKLASSKK
jgi:PadR family transcriptional regulator PadR